MLRSQPRAFPHCVLCNKRPTRTSIPKGERRVMDEIFRFMRQSHISGKNVVRLEQMVKSDFTQ